jgi:hypothetical protein
MITKIELSEAYKMADRMAKPWQYATVVLTGVLAMVLTYLLASETSVDVVNTAKDVTATMLESFTTLGGN